MEINFGPKKVWRDLIESKENLKYLVGIGILLIVLSLVDVIFKVKIFSSLGSLVLYGYLALMANNIIQDKTPILENIGNNNDEKRNLFLVILKGIGIGIVYGLALVVVGIILFLIFSKVLMLNIVQSSIMSLIFLLPMLIIVSMSNLLFAENLNFGDAFNIKRAVESFKFAWGKYLTVWVINILLMFLLFGLLMIIIIPIAVSLIFMLKNYPVLALTKETERLIGGILGSVFGQIVALLISYWYMNAVAQVYKYSLSKMEITEN